MPRKKFDREAADKLWANYTQKLISSITDSEREGLEKGYSSHEIEKLWQKKAREAAEKKETSLQR